MAHAVERSNSSTVSLLEKRLSSTNYRILNVLGEGTYGTVYLARDVENQQFVAIKVIEKRRISPEDMVRVRREIEVLSMLRQPNIIQIFGVHEDDTSLYLVMEYADGGELYDLVERRKKLTSADARGVFRQIVAAVHYCHKNGIVHRDLKLENILLNARFEIKLTDFGLCNYYSTHNRLQTFCGSPLYASPEIISGLPYIGPEIDCWSLGVLLYALVYGSMPFGHAEFAKLRAQILSGKFFAPPEAGEFSDAHELICQCLCVVPSQRATIDQISMHWWTNVDYAHYPYCDIYGSVPRALSPGQVSAATSCSCFFDVLSPQLSKPPAQFRGKAIVNQRNNLHHRFVGAHAHSKHHRHHHKSHKHKQSSSQQPPTNIANAYPTPSSPLASNRKVVNGFANFNGGLHRAVSVDSLNGAEPSDLPELDSEPKNDEVPELILKRTQSLSVSQQNQPMKSSKLSRSASDGKLFISKSRIGFDGGVKDKLLGSLLDPSVEHLEWTGLQRQMSNYDNCDDENVTDFTSQHSAKPANNAFENCDKPQISYHHQMIYQSPLSDSSSGAIANHAYSGSSGNHQNHDVSSSSSCSSESLSCSCSCSSIYDGFVGQAAIQQQAAALGLVPPLEFLTSPVEREGPIAYGRPIDSSPTDTSCSSTDSSSCSANELVVGGRPGEHYSARSAPGALETVDREIGDLRVLDDDEVLAIAQQQAEFYE